MPSFSSVVRKPGQKIQPKGPRKNVPRHLVRPVAPPSLTPESQTVSPAIEPVDKVPESQQGASEQEQGLEGLQNARAGNAIPSIVTAIAPLLERARDNIERTTPTAEATTDPETSATVLISDLSSVNHDVQIIHPVRPNEDRRQARADGIPTISVSTTSSTLQKRKVASAPTPTPSEDSSQERGIRGQSKKRQKTAHVPEVAEALDSQTPPPSLPLPSVPQTSPRPQRSDSRTSDALLQDATTQAAAVSEMAHDIENRVRATRSRSERRSTSQATETGESTVEESTQTQAKRGKKKKKSKSSQILELAQRVVEIAVRGDKDRDDTDRRNTSRLDTPEGADKLRIDPQEVSMSELTKDMKIGRKSETEKRMQENWGDIKERRKKEVDKRRDAAIKKKNPTVQEKRAPEGPTVPVQVIVDGQIQVTVESREVAFAEGLEAAVRENVDVAIEDDRIYKYVNQGTLGKKAGHDKRGKWNEDNTNLFYQGLRMFGTDFSMIANLFPETVDRMVVKKKYQAELQNDVERVEKCVTAKESVSLDEYATMTNMEFEDPEKLMEELAAEEKRLREEDEKRRADQGYMMNDEEADVPIPTTERDDADESIPAGEGEQPEDDTATPAPPRRTQAPSTGRSEQIRAVAERVVQDAAATKKKQQRRTRESTGAGRGGRGGRKGKRAAEGIEERVGPLDELQ